ncbi:MAG: hypothetical protein ABI554_10425 [Flavobacterium sp.]
MIECKSFRYLLFLLLFFNIVRGQGCESCNKKIKHKFLLLKEKGISVDTSLVKINGVYISEYSRINLDKTPQTLYYFYRFFENGKIYMSCGYCSFPNELELNNLKYGFYGEYRVENDKIVIESFAGYPGYFLKYFKIDGDKIFITNVSKRKFTGKIDLEATPYDEYQFYKCNLSSESFW